MWLLRIEFSSEAEKLPFLSQEGSCEYQARVWPRTPCLWAAACATRRSAAAQLKLPRVGSTASHFIAFSAVTELNSRSRTVVYDESEVSGVSPTAAPIFTPRPSAYPRRVVAA